MKILILTTLYPNHIKNGHGIFVEQRLRKLLDKTKVTAEVIAPVPWFPLKGLQFGRYALFAQIAPSEERFNIKVSHPRYFLLPKIGMTLAPLFMVAALYPLLKARIQQGDDFDVIDAHYYYPDGVAAVALGKLLKKPVVVTAHGSDINLLPNYFAPRQMIIWAINQASAIITVCNALKDKIVGLSPTQTPIQVLRNGVDLDFFQPGNREKSRAILGVNNFTLLMVGHLVELKGHHLVIEALLDLPGCNLLIAGDGEEMPRLKKQVRDLGLVDRVIFLGAISHQELITVYNAADLLVLASSREGWPNVLMEAMACGTPVVATHVSGVPEIVTAEAAGMLIEERSAKAISQAVQKMQAHMPDRAETRRFAGQFSWDEPVQGIERLFNAVVKNYPSVAKNRELTVLQRLQKIFL